MCTVYLTGTGIYGGSYDTAGFQLIYQHADSCDIGYGIHGAYFVKMYITYGQVMYMRLSLRDEFIDSQNIILNIRRKLQIADDMLYIMKGRVVV